MNFFRQDLGFGLKLPPCLGKLISSEEQARPRLDISAEIDERRKFAFVLGSGSINGAESTVMESHVTTEISGTLEQNELMTELDRAQDIASEFFMGLIKDIEDRFK